MFQHSPKNITFVQILKIMGKIVFLDASTLGNTSLEEIAKLGELVCYETSTQEEALQRVEDCEVVIVNKVLITRELLDKAPKLKLVCVSATGVNNIDLEACAQRGIPVKNVAGYSTEAVVQATFMHILALAGQSQYLDDCVKSGKYSGSPIFTDVSHPAVELSGKKMGIIGMGNIGYRVAKVAEAFGMKVSYFSTSGTGHCKEYECLGLDDLLRTSDIVSIHAPLNERTKGLIGKSELEKMRKNAILVNMGRGGIVDEVALAEAIDSEQIAGAALDVFEKEPIEAENPLLRTKYPERLRFSPHSAWASDESIKRLVKLIAENISTFYSSENL